jgi:hypothetical protein
MRAAPPVPSSKELNNNRVNQPLQSFKPLTSPSLATLLFCCDLKTFKRYLRVHGAV